MTIWILALGFMGLGSLVNFYNGAIRAAFSFLGLLLAAALAQPIGGLIKPLLSLVTIQHPVGQAFLAPIIAFLVIVSAFVLASIGVHRKVDAYYKYKSSDTQRGLFERMNTRVGLCLGLLNGAIYAYAICVPLSVLGYFTTQAGTEDKDSITMNAISALRNDMRATKFDQAIAGFTPSVDFFYDAADILALIHRNPLIQSRLSSYPVFLTLAEKPDFQQVAGDVQFQEFWQRQPQPAIQELAAHDRIKPLVDNIELYTNVIAMLGGDLKDLKGYLETGKSAKYDDEKVLGRWHFDYRQSMAKTRRSKPNWNSVELNRLKQTLNAGWPKSILTATIDNEITVKMSAGSGIKGTWASLGGERYTFKVTEGGRAGDLDAQVEGKQILVKLLGMTLVFEK